MAAYFARLKNFVLRKNDTGPPQDVTVDGGEADYGKQEKKKMSFFNPLDPVPKYDFYAKDTWTGRVKNSRPTLDVLRKPVSKAFV